MDEYVEKAAFREHLDSVPPFTKGGQRDPKYDFAKTIFLSELAAYPAADVAPVQRWIPVTERLPDVWSDVLVAVLKHRPKSEPVRTMAVDFITMTGEWAKMSCDWRNEVTHWMPLPTPPKEET